MFSHEDSEQLTRVGKGTPLGEMMRRYWHPVATSAQVEADGPPLRSKLLGERLVVFRDTSGKVGVLKEACMHRQVSLALGRNEEGGLRCIYHGWKFAADGTILETPNNSDCRLRDTKKAPAYPVREQSGIIWTYIGPPELEPPFRTFGYDNVPEENRLVLRANTKAAWLPLWEGGLDSSHVAVLHTNQVRPSWGQRHSENDRFASAAWDSLAPIYEIEDTEFGFQYCAFRDMPGQAVRNARLVPAIMPYIRIIPGKNESNYVFEVPMDDFETATYLVVYSEKEPINRDLWLKILGYDSQYYDPVTCDVTLDWTNRLGQDPSKMSTSWSGIQGLEMEDFAMSLSLGDIDRTQENLVTADLAVVRMRRMVLRAVEAHKKGEAPPCLNQADMSTIIGYDLDLPPEEPWRAHAPGNRILEPAE